MKKLWLVCAAMGLLAGQTSDASGTPIDLGTWNRPSGGGSALAQLEFLNSTVLPAYNAAYDPDLEPATYATDDIEGPGGTSFTLALGGYQYLKIKWANQWQYYYVGGDSGLVTFVNGSALNRTGKPQAISHYTFFGPFRVPDRGATLALLCAGLFALGLGRRACQPS